MDFDRDFFACCVLRLGDRYLQYTIDILCFDRAGICISGQIECAAEAAVNPSSPATLVAFPRRRVRTFFTTDGELTIHSTDFNGLSGNVWQL